MLRNNVIRLINSHLTDAERKVLTADVIEELYTEEVHKAMAGWSPHNVARLAAKEARRRAQNPG